MTEFDIGKLVFGDHKCFHCERVVQDYEPHIHVPMNDYLVKEMGVEPLMGEIGEAATLVFCSECIEKNEDGYVDEAHEVVVPDAVPEEWTAHD